MQQTPVFSFGAPQAHQLQQSRVQQFQAAQVAQQASLPLFQPFSHDVASGAGESGPLVLDVKRIHRRFNPRIGRFEDEEVAPTSAVQQDLDGGFAFTIVENFNPPLPVTTSLVIRSPFFIDVAKVVMQSCRDIIWTSKPLQFSPNQLLAWLPRFKAHLASCEARSVTEEPPRTEDEQQTIEHLSFFIRFLEEEFKSTLSEVAAVLNEGKITFDLLWSIFLPGTILVTSCNITGQPILVRLISGAYTTQGVAMYHLKCEFVDFAPDVPSTAEVTISISGFEGTRAVTDLSTFPMEPFMPEESRVGLRAMLVARGRRYAELSSAWCHKRYTGIAYRDDGRKIGVNSRIILDRTLYSQRQSSLMSTQHVQGGKRRKVISQEFNIGKDNTLRTPLSEDEFMLLPAVMHGFSLGDRKWLRFDVNLVEDIIWNPGAFDLLDIPEERKEIVRTLTESHSDSGGFDDFIEGKGVGLIFNLHGPPGVGKTLTAEATSEVTRRPLYVVSAGDLGTTAGELDEALTRVFSLACAWRAIVLIDEADVFLEQRNLHDLQRNAMVAVFLRQLEYYPGILFLTTNRMEVIDSAIKSRIHVSLDYDELNFAARKRLWETFLNKAGIAVADVEALDALSQRELNGREIKNIVKVAVTSASYYDRDITMADVSRLANAGRKRSS